MHKDGCWSNPLYREVKLCQIETERAREGKHPEPAAAGEKVRAADVARDLEKPVETMGAVDSAADRGLAAGNPNNQYSGKHLSSQYDI